MKKVSILLAEDDPNLGQLLKNYLSVKEYETTLVTDGAQAMKLFRKEKFTSLPSRRDDARDGRLHAGKGDQGHRPEYSGYIPDCQEPQAGCH